jgi:predicted TIM-barrel fold metal-dependent hydrolase
MIEQWYERDARMRGSIIVPWRDADLAIREIERVGNHPRVAQVVVTMCMGVLYGQRHFHPIWEAAAQHGLVLGVHFGGNEPPRATGAVPSFYLEYHCNMAQAAMAHIVSFGTGRHGAYRELRVRRNF